MLSKKIFFRQRRWGDVACEVQQFLFFCGDASILEEKYLFVCDVSE